MTPQALKPLSNAAFSPSRIKKGFIIAWPLLSPAGHCLQRSVANCDRVKIAHTYQSVIGGFTAPQIWPHLAVLVLRSLLRYTASQIPTILPRRCRSALREQGCRLLKMKEYDAQSSLGSFPVVDHAFVECLRPAAGAQRDAR